ncbi:kielin/chordin-like protein [Ornithodoros turicata]|uniref:kielin/chordin-like protein n=1 Tax=Ornithodoros turicata TaxID=34597 RepID=UPI003138F2E4
MKTLFTVLLVFIVWHPGSLNGARHSFRSSYGGKAYGSIRKEGNDRNTLSVTDQSSCTFEGKLFRHGSNISRSDPCERCFCFRGEVLCWNIQCPDHKPRDNCRAVSLKWTCCPIYECESAGAVSTEKPPDRWSPFTKATDNEDKKNVDCEVDGDTYRPGQVIPSASGACLECRCGDVAQIQCTPKPCRYTVPLIVPGASAQPVRITPNPFRRSLF